MTILFSLPATVTRSLPLRSLASVLLGLALAGAPIGFGNQGSLLGGPAAYANNGGGGGGGHGGGNGNGNGNGNGASAAKSLSAGSDTGDDSDPSSHGALASSLGGLNAAHASLKALDNANPNSRVGRIATYGKVVAAEDTLADPNATEEEKEAAQSFLEGLGLADLTAEEAERASLEEAANKTVTDKVMDAVNDLLGL